VWRSLRSATAGTTGVGGRKKTERGNGLEFRSEKMPERFSTRVGYDAWFNNHILPRWGHGNITAVQPRPVELWLRTLPISPKSKVHIRGLLRALWDYSMWRGEIPAQRNPMELVTIKGATKRLLQPRSLTVEEFHKFLAHLEEPVRTIALICVCFGLRISECLALKWSDIDWLNAKLHIQRSIVRQRVGDVKTVYSGKTMCIDPEMIELLKVRKQTTPFPDSRRRRLDFCKPGETRSLAGLLSVGMVAVPEGCQGCGNRQTGHALPSPQLSFLAGRSGNRHCRSAEADAALGHSNHPQHLRGRGYERNGRGPRQDRALSAAPSLVI
jgi:integrase